jgi:hypothetical protein
MTDRCPVCGRPAAFTVASAREQDATLARLYRHRHQGRTWLHRIRFSWRQFAAVRPAEVQV